MDSYSLTFYSLILTGVLILFISCNSGKTKNHDPSKPESKSRNIDTTIYSFVHFEAIDTINITSDLSNKTDQLIHPNDKYKILQKGRIKKQSSTVIKGVQQKPELCFSPKYCYKLKSVPSLLNSIYQINYVKLSNPSKHPTKGALALEEIIFYSDKDSKALQDYIR